MSKIAGRQVRVVVKGAWSQVRDESRSTGQPQKCIARVAEALEVTP